jgi:hypothetical protein
MKPRHIAMLTSTAALAFCASWLTAGASQLRRHPAERLQARPPGARHPECVADL